MLDPKVETLFMIKGEILCYLNVAEVYLWYDENRPIQFHELTFVLGMNDENPWAT